MMVRKRRKKRHSFSWGKILFFGSIFLFLVHLASPAAKEASGGKAIILPLKGAVNPAMSELVSQSFKAVKKEKGRDIVVVLKIDTPGGLLVSTREIVEEILSCPVPIIGYISPAGAQCASAGTFIALACPVLAMAPGTSIGAAHPVMPIGKMEKIHQEKVVNDAVAWITSLAERWGRNKYWAEKAVRESAAINEKEAVRLKVADLVAEDLTQLLFQIDGRKIVLDSRMVILNTKEAKVEEIPINFRQRILQVVSDPNIAYLLFLLGILGILAEFSTPGIGFPGIVGFISLLLAFYGLSALPVNIAGIALILVAIAFFILEAYTPTFGLLGMGGIVALVFGSLLLIRPFSYLKPPSRFSSLLVAFVFAGLVLLMARFAFRAMRRKVSTGKEGMVGEIGEARTDLTPQGIVYVHGEYWTACTLDEEPVKKGEKVCVEKVSGRILLVKRFHNNKDISGKTAI